MRIQHNIMAMNAYRNLGINNKSLSKNLEKLSSGFRINRAGDDAAGLAISEKMRSQIAGLDQAQKNAQSGINMIQTAEGALTEVHDMLNRMVTLATQAANGTYVAEDQQKIQSEINALTEEIDRIATESNFNGQKLLNGDLAGAKITSTPGVVVAGRTGATDNDTPAKVEIDFTGKTGKDVIGGKLEIGDKKYQFVKTGEDAETGYTKVEVAADADATAIAGKLKDAVGTNVAKYGADSAAGKFTLTESAVNDDDAADLPTVKQENVGGLTLQIGANASETITVQVEKMDAASLGIDGASINVGDVTSANAAITAINAAIEKVSVQRSNLGAYQNRLEHTINNLGVMEENIQDAEATIRDTDIADEMMAYTKNNILIQSAQAMLAQANQVPQGVLQLMQ